MTPPLRSITLLARRSSSCHLRQQQYQQQQELQRRRILREFSTSRQKRKNQHGSATTAERKRSNRPQGRRRRGLTSDGKSNEVAPVDAVETVGHSATKATSPSVAGLQQQVAMLFAWRLRYLYNRGPSFPPPVSLSILVSDKNYSGEHGRAAFVRLPAALAALAILWWWEESAPYSIIRLTGPSMIPTIAPDGSEIWLVRNLRYPPPSSTEETSRDDVSSPWFLGFFVPWQTATLQKGDLIGFAHPQTAHALGPTNSSRPQQTDPLVSCKRITGLPGDTVARYGAYVHLFALDDPVHLGQSWPSAERIRAQPLYQRCRPPLPPTNQPVPNPYETRVVPPRHVWVESDCPGLGIDSRQLGPIPMAWVRGRIVARLWPLWDPAVNGASTATSSSSWKQRPHPIPLDDQTLARYNVHRKNPSW